MSHSAGWKAIATRFAAIASGPDFNLWAYSDSHPPVGVNHRELRRTWDTDGLEFNTGHTALTIQGRSPLSHHEFLLLNRLVWLAWAAGTLLRPNSVWPERDWFIHVFRESQTSAEMDSGQARLSRLAAHSANVAKQLSGVSRVPESQLPVPTGGAWQMPFETLRNSFNTFALESTDFRLELHGYTNPRLFDNDEAVRGIHGRGLRSDCPDTFGRSGWHTLVVEAKKFNQFNDLATQAGRSLPSFLKPSANMFPSGFSHLPSQRNEMHVLDWCMFLWTASPSSFRRCLDSSDDGARRAVWQGGNPFLASVLAIDLFVRAYGLETVSLYSRSLAEVCPWYSLEDRSAALAAVSAAFVEPDRSLPETPVPLGSKSRAAKSSPRVLNLLQLQSKIAELHKAGDSHETTASRANCDVAIFALAKECRKELNAAFVKSCLTRMRARLKAERRLKS